MSGRDTRHDLLTITEAAEALGVTRRTTYRYIRKGQLAALRHAGKTFVSREQIGEYFARQVAKGDYERARLEKMARAATAKR